MIWAFECELFVQLVFEFVLFANGRCHALVFVNVVPLSSICFEDSCLNVNVL